jgi:hypothetical protein
MKRHYGYFLSKLATILMMVNTRSPIHKEIANPVNKTVLSEDAIITPDVIDNKTVKAISIPFNMGLISFLGSLAVEFSLINIHFLRANCRDSILHR